MDPTMDFARHIIRKMVFVMPDGGVRPASVDAIVKLPPVGSIIEVKNTDGIKKSITVQSHLPPMTAEEFQDLENHLLSLIRTEQ